MSENLKILVIEDERDIKDLLLLHLKREGYTVQAVENGEEALSALANGNYHLIVLDWMLPGISGLELCKHFRKERGKNTPILMVTARTDTADIVLGLEMGADDYITKPFEIPVLLARVRALLRRSLTVSIPDASKAKIKVDALTLDLEAYKAHCDQEELQLTPSEFKLLSALMANQGRVLTRERLIDLVQGEGVAVVDRTVDTHVFGLRKKLGKCSDFIETIRGIGYRMKADEKQ